MCDKEIVVCAAIWVQDHKNKPHGPVNILRKGISELESKSNSSDSNIGVSCVCIQESHLL
jgi:hypothetical protein